MDRGEEGWDWANMNLIIVSKDEWLTLSIRDILVIPKGDLVCVDDLDKIHEKLSEGYAVILIDALKYNRLQAKNLEWILSQYPQVQILLILDEEGIAYAGVPQNERLHILVKENMDSELPLLLRRLFVEQFEMMQQERENITIQEKRDVLMKEESTGVLNKPVSRRMFIKGSAAAAAAVGVAASLPGIVSRQALAATSQEAGQAAVQEQTFISTCRSACSYHCSLKIHVRDGIMHNVSPNPFPDENYTGVCLRGLSHVQRTYSPNRLKYPMRRVGERGSGQWERISWDEAIKEIGQKLSHIRDTYGPKSIVVDSQAGNLGGINGTQGVVNRLPGCIGCTVSGDVYDRAAGHGATRVMGCGPYEYANEHTALLDAKMIIVWGTNPVISGPHVWRFIQMAKDKGAKVVCLDPVKSATAHKSDQYIPVVPGSDLYIVLAMSNYIIENNLMNIEFLKKRSNAPFLVRRDNGEMYTNVPKGVKRKEQDYYVFDPVAQRVCLLSEAVDVALEGSYTINGVEVDTSFTLLKNHLKQYTIADAAKISGVPEATIVELVKSYATIGPVTINLMYGLDHYRNGHLFFQAAGVMQTLTGNFARPGAGFSGVFITGTPANYGPVHTPNNPKPTQVIPSFHLYNVWRDQKFKGQPYPLKAVITANSNSMSNYAEQKRWFTDVFPNMEYWVVIDNEMTDCARHADIVLPAAYWFEMFDVRNIYMPYYTIAEKAIEPLYECKPDSEIFKLIANAMGYGKEFPAEYTSESWGEIIMNSDGLRARGITMQTLREKKIIRFLGQEGVPVLRGSKELPFETSHGRLMIYWEDPIPRDDFGQEITPEMVRKERLPYFRPPSEAWKTNPLFEKYPLVYYQEKSRYRTHTQWFSVPLLKELEPEPVAKMSREDADKRGIKNGDLVEVYNDRGYVVVKAVIDDNMGAGMLNIPKGWQRHQFISGCYQDLTSAELDPWAVAGAWSDALVNVRKWNK